jgi:hypothetical protein
LTPRRCRRVPGAGCLTDCFASACVDVSPSPWLHCREMSTIPTPKRSTAMRCRRAGGIADFAATRTFAPSVHSAQLSSVIFCSSFKGDLLKNARQFRFFRRHWSTQSVVLSRLIRSWSRHLAGALTNTSPMPTRLTDRTGQKVSPCREQSPRPTISSPWSQTPSPSGGRPTRSAQPLPRAESVQGAPAPAPISWSATTLWMSARSTAGSIDTGSRTTWRTTRWTSMSPKVVSGAALRPGTATTSTQGKKKTDFGALPQAHRPGFPANLAHETAAQTAHGAQERDRFGLICALNARCWDADSGSMSALTRMQETP